MKFRVFFSVKRHFSPLILIFLALSGCGSKQDAPPQAEIAPPILDTEAVAHESSLDGHELKALRDTGQIDKNVPDEAMPDIAVQYKYFLRNGRKTMCAFSRQSEQYLAYARKVFRDRGMPEELANLAIVESGYRPTAVSRAGAAGAWQFMPFTGAKYGLAQDWWQDERLDPWRSTEAAADYLQKLYNDFGDWPTAIAAYNAGEGKMSRAKAGTGGKDFFEVKAMNHTLDEKTRLREETKQYVPRFMAVTKIMRNLPQLGFEPIQPENQPEVCRLTAKPGTDLAAFSKACNLGWDEFKSYNPHHKRNITCSERPTFVYVPSRAQKLASQYLCSAQPASYAGWRPVRIHARNDSIEKISSRSKIPLNMLQAANPGLGRLKRGQTILAPSTVNLSSQPMETASARPMKTGKKGKNLASAAKGGDASRSSSSHILREKETLYAVARKYNVNVNDLMRHNGIDNPGKLMAGHEISIPGKNKNAPHKGSSSGKIGARKARATYTVQNRDNLWAIARKHKVSVGDLKRWNNVSENNLKPGARLIVAED